MVFRLTSPLDAETEAVVAQVVDCALEVHKQLGPGLLESIYSDAFALELDHRKLPFERERPVQIYYRDKPLRIQRVDLIVEDRVLIKIKAPTGSMPSTRHRCCPT